jgi:hypothetical protein
MNVYGIFHPHRFFKRKTVQSLFQMFGLKILEHNEKGLFFTPFFSNVLVFFFDAIDVILFRKKGSLGPVGIAIRRIVEPIVKWEYSLPVDYGYTLFVIGKRS